MRLQGLTMTVNTNLGRVSIDTDNNKTSKPAEKHNFEFAIDGMEVGTSDYKTIFSGDTKVLKTLIQPLELLLQKIDIEGDEKHAIKVESLNNKIRLAKKDANTPKTELRW